jgi:hypothetical protein
MKTLIGRWLLASLGLTMLAEAREPGLRIEVLVYNYAGLSAETLAKAEQEAARIYERAGLETQWLDCPLSPAEADQYPACQLPVGVTRLALRLLSREMAERRKSDPMTFGFALLPEGGGFGTIVNVYPHRAGELAKGREKTQAVILGHLMAHELGHLLLGVGSHSANGLMHVPWRKKELELVAQGSMFFTPWQAEQMRTQVAARLASEQEGRAPSAR